MIDQYPNLPTHVHLRRPSSPCRHRRQVNRIGTTLIEVIGTLAVMLILAISAVTLLRAITDIGQRDSAARQTQANLHRLARDYRNDVRHATSIEIPNDGTSLTLVINADGKKSSGSTDHTLVYSLHATDAPAGHEIRRIKRDGNATRLSIESYWLSEKHTPSFKRDDDFVSLILGRVDPEATNKKSALRPSIVARLSTDERNP